jgi:hypothetical protein
MQTWEHVVGRGCLFSKYSLQSDRGQSFQNIYLTYTKLPLYLGAAFDKTLGFLASDTTLGFLASGTAVASCTENARLRPRQKLTNLLLNIRTHHCLCTFA